MSVEFSVDDRAIPDHVEAVRLKILAALREGMGEAMQGLAWTVAGKLDGSPIVSRSGDLLSAILDSPKVTQTSDYIRGTVGGLVNGKPLEIWLEEGISVPAVTGKLYQFTPADGESVWTHGHGAFQVAAKPFMNPSLNEYKPTLIDLITSRLEAALDGA